MLQEIPKSPALPDSPQITAAEAAAAARAVMRLFDLWGLPDAQARAILGGMSARTHARWKAGEFGRIGRDLATRLSLVMGIHKGLRYLFTDPRRGYDWIAKPNAAFGGQSAAQIMARGDIFALMRVRAYLDAERGGW